MREVRPNSGVLSNSFDSVLSIKENMAEPLALGLITSLHPTPREALRQIRELDIPTVQLQYRADLDDEAGLEEIRAALAETGIEITAIFSGFAGESYDSIPLVRETVGLVPQSTRAERVALTRRISECAQKLGVARIAAHIGFVPEDASDSQHAELVETVRGICADLKTRGQGYSLETGQETAGALKKFIAEVGADNLYVNFDPANMLLYGNDNPIEATKLLASHIDSVHCKDATRSPSTDVWGEEKPFGDGEVDVPKWISTLLETGFRGVLTIEREISGDEQKKDIARARDLIRGELAKHK